MQHPTKINIMDQILRVNNFVSSQGKLTLVNQSDGTEHHFVLRGEAQKPLALDHILVECQAREK